MTPLEETNLRLPDEIGDAAHRIKWVIRLVNRCGFSWAHAVKIYHIALASHQDFKSFTDAIISAATVVNDLNNLVIKPPRLCERCVYIFGKDNALPAEEEVPGILKKTRYLCRWHAAEYHRNMEG